MTDINAVWSSLTSEDGGSLPSKLMVKTLPIKKDAKPNKNKKQQIIALRQQTQPVFDIDSFTSSVGVAPIQATDASEAKEGETLADNLSELVVEFSAWNYDSDDEEDEETLSSPDKKNAQNGAFGQRIEKQQYCLAD